MVRSIPQLEALREEWNALAAPFQSPLLEHDWFLSCAEAFHSDGELRIVTLRQAGTLVGVAPLARETSTRGARLALLGVSRLYEPSGCLTAADTFMRDLVAKVVRLGDPVVLQRIPDDSPLCEAVTALPRTRAVAISRSGASSLGVVMGSSWEAYRDGLSSHITGNLKRLRKKVQREFGTISVRQTEPKPGEVEQELETVVSVEGSGWKGRKGSSLARRPDLREFFVRYCRRAAERGCLRVTTLRFGSQVAAVELAVEAYGRMWQLKIGYSESLSAFYPGLHLTEAAIRAAFDRGLRSYEFLGSAAEWERRWNPDERRYRLLVLYPLSVAGILTGCRDVAERVWRQASPQLMTVSH